MNKPKLSDDYRLKNVIDFRYNGKLVLLVNLGMVAITFLLIWGMVQVRDFTLLLPLDEDYSTFQRLMVPFSILILLFLYSHVRELIHAACFWLVSKRKPKYRMRVFSATSGVPDFYFDKKSYALITLGPLVILAVVMMVILAFLPNPWFWVVYIVLAFHLSTGVKDAYVCSAVRDAQPGSYILDDGVKVKVYSVWEEKDQAKRQSSRS